MDTETATATPRSAVSVSVQARGLRLVQDKPADLGGRDEGMMASELLMAALLGCQNSTFVKVAAKRRVDVRLTRLEAATHFEGGGISRIDVTLHARAPDDVGDDKLETLARLTDRSCTISKAMAVPVHVTIVRARTG